ncbi:hypothetical protein OWR29_25490 [Actinoplanes sp. Pm04-4]|uniref:Uncharacterized protein n=1 Tax=Paractinoplanes pyxinae TaxID=2997416 RepID=A0ABT4B4G1_9ACTN|nr:hypothetical protein [Actinoplanes pyxinae]MCY1141366.1 hypothetical protein [Actinoplanes pyxinae]
MVLVPVILSLAVNEACDISPWLAKRIVPRAARMWAGSDATRAAILQEEWAAVIDDCPGKIIKLGYALSFFASAARRSQWPKITNGLVRLANRMFNWPELGPVLRVSAMVGVGLSIISIGVTAGLGWVGALAAIPVVTALIDLGAIVLRCRLRREIRMYEARIRRNDVIIDDLVARTQDLQERVNRIAKRQG